ncbi:hypothetical protein [Rossellomorea aquimaris]|uniref:hypothetical protein n=1 Tax=Rossellomorea aquimaris TaxID=189382 RepID=UPI0011E989F0|nr:hypothetical protein [Rossellomorea aquimaris]TYS87510.1 hypothetical protein FZC88_16070 [Rossellomorea aquimaris]
MFSIVNIVQSLELVFKEVLRRENEIFLYDNIDKPKNTVSITKAIYRLKNIIKIDLKEQDERIINKAIEIRNNIIHFEVELDVKDLSNTYVVIFSFLKSFHYRFLKSDLHEFIDNEYWEEENELILEKFSNPDVLHKEANNSSEYLLEVAESQLYTFCIINGVEYKRIVFGEEAYDYSYDFCGDCAIRKGHYHVSGCDMEVCPKCLGQKIGCDCTNNDELLHTSF